MSDETNTPPSGADEIRAEIEQTRAELADTVNRLSDKMNVKAQVGHKADSVKQSVADQTAHLKQSAPDSVQHALDTIGEKAGPVAGQVNAATAPHRGKIIGGAVGALVVVLFLRRRRKGKR